jgi:hypothetical protein
VKIAFYLFLIQLLFACAKRHDQRLSANSYSHDVVDILFDAVLDDPAFLLCDSIKITTSRSALAYQGNRSAIAQVVKINLSLNLNIRLSLALSLFGLLSTAKTNRGDLDLKYWAWIFKEKNVQRHLLNMY